MELALSSPLSFGDATSMALAQCARIERARESVQVAFSTAMWRSGVAAGMLAWRAARVARDSAQFAVWMRGARSFVVEQAWSTEEGRLEAALRRTAASGEKLRALILDVLPSLEKARLGSTRPALQRSLRDLAKHTAIASKEAESFAAELAVREANYSSRESGWTASTPEEVRELFARL